MATLLDRVQESTTTTGTGAYALSGAVTGFRSFNSQASNGTIIRCVIEDGVGGYEVGDYTLGTNTLTRTTIIESSNSNNAVNWGSGTKLIYSDATVKDVLPDQTGNSGKFLITSGTDPSWSNSVNSLTLTGGTANGVLYLNGSKAATSGSALTFDGTTFTSTGVQGILSTVGGNTARMIATAGGTYFGSTTAADVIFQYNGSEQMRLTTTGLGIGTSSPATWTGAKLVLQTVTSTASQFAIDNSSYAAGQIIGIDLTVGGGSKQAFMRAVVENGTTAATSLTFGTASAGNNVTERMRLDSSGNLGLGVTPSAWNTSVKAIQAGFAGAGAFSARTDAFQADISLNAYDTGSDAWKYIQPTTASKYTQVSGQHQWHIAPSGTAGAAISFTQAMTLDSSGNLLVGETGNGLRNANGISLEPYSGGAYAVINHLNGTASGSQYIFFGYNGVKIGDITQNGTTGVLYNITSDQRLKTDLGVATSTAVIDNTIIHDFEWKSDGSKSRGVFAQEAYEVKPEAVSIGKDELNEDGLPVQPWGVDYSKYVPDLIVYCQQLKAELDELKTKIGK